MGHLQETVATDAAFASMKRVCQDSCKTLHADLVRLARERGAITDFAVQWYADFAKNESCHRNICCIEAN